jgi:hypothetical protein
VGSVTVLVRVLELVESLVFGIEQCAVLSEELVVHHIAEHYVAPPASHKAFFALTYHYRRSCRSDQLFVGLSSPLPKFVAVNFGLANGLADVRVKP